MNASDRLNELDKKYPNVFRMPDDVREEYTRLSIELVGDVRDERMKDHGSIHSHLEAGEKDGS